MPTTEPTRRFRAAPSLSVLCGIVLGLGFTAARAEPPIRSPEDAACRLEARARVFVTPNPKGLELEVIGRQIYDACLRRLTQPAAPPRRQGTRGHRHRRHR